MSRLRRNIVYNFVGQLLTLALGFAFTRYVYRGLGKDVLGIIYFAMMLNTAIAGLLEMGIGALVVKEVAGSIDRDDGYVRRLLRTGALYFWSIYVIIVVVQLALAPWLVEGWLQLETLSQADGTAMLRILCAGVFLAFPKTLYLCVFRGLQRMGVTNVIDVSATLFQQAGVIALVLMGETIYPVVTWIALSYALRVVAYQILLVRTFSWSVLIPGYDKEVVRRNTSFGLHLIGTMMLGTVFSQGDKLVISKLLPLGHVGWYGFAFAAVSKSKLLTAAVATAGYPRLSELVQGGDRTALERTYRGLHALMCLGLVPVFAAVPFVVPLVFPVVLDAEATAALWLPTTILGLGFYLAGTTTMPHFLALAHERADIGMRQNFYALFVVFPTMVALIFVHGLTGAAIGWVVYQLWSWVYGVRRIYRECLGWSPLRFYREIGYAVVLTALSYGVAFTALWRGPGFGLLAVTVAYLAASLAYVAMVWWVADEDVRTEIRRMLRRSIPDPETRT